MQFLSIVMVVFGFAGISLAGVIASTASAVWLRRYALAPQSGLPLLGTNRPAVVLKIGGVWCVFLLGIFLALHGMVWIYNLWV